LIYKTVRGYPDWISEYEEVTCGNSAVGEPGFVDLRQYPQTPSSYRPAALEVEINEEEELSRLLDPEITTSIVLEFENGKQVRTTRGKRMGHGGDKSIYEINGGLVIYLPNPEDGYTEFWSSQIVDKELKDSEKLNNVGLLGSRLVKVNVYPSESSDFFIPALITESFETLKSQGISVLEIETANTEFCPILSKYLRSLEEGVPIASSDIQYWKPLETYIKDDLVKILLNDITTSGDSFHLARIDNPNGTCDLRYFGFDFVKDRPVQRKLNEKTIKYRIVSLVDWIVRYYERLWKRYKLGDRRDEITDFLTNHYLPYLLEAIGVTPSLPPPSAVPTKKVRGRYVLPPPSAVPTKKVREGMESQWGRMAFRGGKGVGW